MKRIIIGLFIFMSFMVMHEASADVGKMLATREEIRERGLTKEIAELIHFVEFYNTEKPEDDGSTIIGVLEHTFDFSKNNDGSVMAYVYAGGAYSIDGESGVYRSLDIYFDTHMSLDKNSSSLFQGFSKLIEIYGLEFVDTSLVENMSGMFSGCINLINLDLGHFNTSKVTNMSQMFSGCKSLKNLNISSFNTSRSMDMASMFYDCESLTSLDLKHFNTENVLDMSKMFSNTVNLENLNLSEFKTNKVTDMSFMFSNTTKLTKLDLNSFDTSNVEDMSYMFNSANKDNNLIELLIGNMEFAKVTNSINMFNNHNPDLMITVKDNSSKEFILAQAIDTSLGDNNVIVLNTSNDIPSSSSDDPSSIIDTPSSSFSIKNNGPIDNPKTGMISFGIIFTIFIISSTAYILFKKDKIFKQI